MLELNCTTPYGPNKDHICKDQEKGMSASKLYKETFEKHDKNSRQNCPRLSEFAYFSE